MMKESFTWVRSSAFRLAVMWLLGAALLGGCNALSGAKPTPAPTQTERVIVVVVTATVPPTDTPNIQIEPTITPLATLTPLTILTPTVAATNTRTPAPRATTANPTRTATPVQTATGSVPPPPNFVYPAPNPLVPGPSDARHTNESIQFEWNFADGRSMQLHASECYLLQVTFTQLSTSQVRGDSFDSCTYAGSFSILAGPRGRFVLNRPKYGSPNYSALAPDVTENYNVQWCVAVVLKTGSADATHIVSTPLSPSGCSTFPMSGG